MMDAAEAYEDEGAAVDPQAFVAAVTASQNLAAELDEAKLSEIGRQCVEDYELDADSMSDWSEKMQKGIDLAKLVKTDKNYPFEGAANIKYPLITSAALQFNARAYPAIVPADRAVKAKVWGQDRQGLKAARAERISQHMSWQLHARVTEWEEETDKMLVQLPIVGTMIRKWWYDPVESRPRVRTLQPGRFIVNDKVTTLRDAPRCTELMALYPGEIETRKRSGQFVKGFEYDRGAEDSQEPQDFIEQHTRLDLDEDGYEEPYVVTVHLETQKVVRIVADFGPEDVSYTTEARPVPVPVPMGMDMMGRPIMGTQITMQEVPVGITAIKRGTYFVAHHFLPSMDGGFWGTGLGILLCDISETVNSIINMMLDSSHFASLGGGFIGSEFRVKGGGQQRRPGEWRQVAASGQDIRSAIVPIQFAGPDATMYQLLGMLLDAGREIASVQDVVTGDAPRQQTATTTLALIEQGMMVFTAAYKRIFMACAQEYGILAKMNRSTVDAQEYTAFHDELDQNGQPVMLDPAQDYDDSDMDVSPMADPRSVTKMQQAAKAQLVMQLAEMGMFAPGPAAERVAEAMDIENVQELIPQPDPMQQQMGMMQMQAAQADLSEKMAKIELILAQVEETRAKTVEAIASAQTDQIRAVNETNKTRLDGLRVMLDDERTRMVELLRATGRMAGASGNGNASGGGGAGNGNRQGAAIGALFGGQPSAGGIPGSGNADGPMGPGVF